MAESDIHVSLNESDCKFVKWKTKLGARVEASNILALYSKDCVELSLKSPDDGIVSFICSEIDEGDMIPPGYGTVKPGV